MIKICRSNHKNRAKDAEILEQFCDRKISREKVLKYPFQDNIISANFGNEIILNSSGQAKVDNLNSCLTFVRSDFIVF